MSLWLFFTTLMLHRLATALTRDSVLAHKRGYDQRNRACRSVRSSGSSLANVNS